MIENMNFNIASQLKSKIPVWLACQRWFTQPPDGSHIDPGFDSRDPAIISDDVTVAKALGFTGFVPDHYSLNEPSHEAQMLLLKECERQSMKFILMQEIKFFADKHAELGKVIDWCRSNMFNSPAYPKIGGKIPVFEFDWGINGVDPNAFMQSNPDIMVLTRNAGPHAYGWPDGFESAAAWRNYVNWYLRTFPDGVAPCFFQFDDHAAPWHPNPARLVPAKNGSTLQFCIDQINAAIGNGARLSGVLFATEDDYDEGTAARDYMKTQVAGMQSVAA